MVFFKIAPKSTIFLGYFCERICCQELSKITQSGHTGGRHVHVRQLNGKPPTEPTHICSCIALTRKNKKQILWSIDTAWTILTLFKRHLFTHIDNSLVLWSMQQLLTAFAIVYVLTVHYCWTLARIRHMKTAKTIQKPLLLHIYNKLYEMTIQKASENKTECWRWRPSGWESSCLNSPEGHLVIDCVLVKGSIPKARTIIYFSVSNRKGNRTERNISMLAQLA